MGIITVNISVSKMQATVNAQNIDAVLQWVKTNIIDKLPADASMTCTLQVVL